MPSDRRTPQPSRRTTTGRRRTTRTTARRPLPSRPTRRTRHRGVARRGLPLGVRIGLGGAVVALAAIALLTATGGLGSTIRQLGSSLASSVGSAIDAVGASASPSVSAVPGAVGIPTLVAPAEPATNQPTIEVTGQLPGSAVGQAGVRVRLYVTRGEAAPEVVAEIPAPATSFFTIPGVPLVEGKNSFTATIVDPAGSEGEPSVAVAWVLDTKPPAVTIGAPEDGATVATATVDVIGKSQRRSSIVIRNATNGRSASGTVEVDGTFRLSIPLETGRNDLAITVTDPAGNVTTKELGVTRSGGAISAELRASTYRFAVAKLPRPLTLSVIVTDPTGAPVVGAAVTFTVSLPGIPVITGDAVTDATGLATFSTTVPAGTAPGTGPATAFVTTADFGTTSARTVITVE